MIQTNKMINSIVVLLTLSLVLTDWRLLSFLTFSDVFMLTILGILWMNRSLVYTKSALQILIMVLGYLCLNFLVQLSVNDDFSIINALIGSLKIMLFLIILLPTFYQIKHFSAEKTWIKMLQIAAIIVCWIGIYIYVAIMFNHALPYRFLWLFTRTDPGSYSLGAFTHIIRMRSIFGEPAHLGFYVMMVLGVSYFNPYGVRISVKTELLLYLSLLLSFSFSTIAVAILIKGLDLVKKQRLFTLDKHRFQLVLVSVIGLILLWFNPMFNTAIVSRISRIFSGVDTSASVRLLGSWSYIHLSNLIFGSGVSNTPLIFNNYAYVISDLGLFGLMIFAYYNVKLLVKNGYLFIVFLLLNFMKGAYLGAGYWVVLCLFSVVAFSHQSSRNNQVIG